MKRLDVSPGGTMNSHNDLRRDLSDVLSENWTPLDGEVAAATHQGHIRDNNEDSYFLMRSGRSLEKLSTDLEECSLEENSSITGYGILVAVGMGGRAAGGVPSRMAICKLIELLV